MPRIEDLQRSILDETPDQLRARIVAIRKDRRISKAPVRAAKKAKRDEDKAATSVRRALNSISPDLLEAMLKELEQ